MRCMSADKRTLARRFARGMATYDGAAVVQREMAERLVAELLSAPGAGRFDRVLELGCGTGLLTQRLLARCRPARLVLNDLVMECEGTARRMRRQAPGVPVQFVHGDMETVAFPHPQDLIASSAVLQWAADSRALLTRMAGLLEPGGLLAIASFGPSNLREVSQLTGVSLRYWSCGEWQAALAEHHVVLSGREELRTLWFPSARDVLRHLKQTGANALDSGPWPPARVAWFCRTYEATFGQDGRVPLTYHPVFMVARKRSDGGSRR
ncbi:MAG: malonyl-ACP O-methyltransferase BioC [Lentisphaerae bacterium]|nr:malonyl-ACP O-methyltransferase BioC [Lentisphaerota bacterium]